MKENFVSRQQVNLLPERLRKAEETNAAKELQDYMWSLLEKKYFKLLKIMIVGSGGSYPAALLGKHALHNELHTPNVEAVTPQTAIKIISQCYSISCCGNYGPIYDLIIGISYSGKSPDIKAVANLCVESGFPFVLLTGTEKSKLLDFYTENESCKIISYFNPDDTTGKEKGMISMFSTLAPATIFDDLVCESIAENQDCLSNGNKYVNSLNVSIAGTIKKYPIIHVFYDWTTLPTAVDIQSKFTESGLANVILHEKNNFSHGCYTSLYNQNFALIINLVRYRSSVFCDTFKFYRNKYDELLSTFLKKRCEVSSGHYLELGTSARTATQWNIEVMTILPYFVTAIGELLDIDISKPLIPFPKEALELYNYKGDFYN